MNNKNNNAVNGAFRFSKLNRAESFRNRAVKAMMILLGENGSFLVVSMAKGEAMIKAGFEAI